MHAVVELAPMGDLADVKRITQQMVERAPAENEAADFPARRRDASLGSDARALELTLKIGDTPQNKVAIEDHSDRLCLWWINEQLTVRQVIA
jgi:hypothetical protein